MTARKIEQSAFSLLHSILFLLLLSLLIRILKVSLTLDFFARSIFSVHLVGSFHPSAKRDPAIKYFHWPPWLLLLLASLVNGTIRSCPISTWKSVIVSWARLDTSLIKIWSVSVRISSEAWFKSCSSAAWEGALEDSLLFLRCLLAKLAEMALRRFP